MQSPTSKATLILKEKFGFNSFRKNQAEVIEHVLRDKDALVIMPTGGGKSMCYQIPALVKEGLTVVVSPLIALMNDQVLNLHELGIEAAALHSNISPAEYAVIEKKIYAGTIKLLYLSPERINTESCQFFLKNLKVDLIAIDEAHCVSIWGNDFRPDYVKLSRLRKIFPEVSIIALTATADTATREDIIKQLQLKAPKVFMSSFERNNITTHSTPGQSRLKKIFRFLDDYPNEAGIVYCLSKKSTELVAKKLKEAGYNASYYHAGMKADDRFRVQKSFQEDKTKIICATIAFGMGIDKPNIRYVIHYNLPKNIEAYYQEIGRAGRDGKPSEALLFYSWADIVMYQSFIEDGQGSKAFKDVQLAKLDRMWEFASTGDCRTNVVLNYFGEFTSKKCGHCDNCLNPPVKFDGSLLAMKALSAIKRTNESMGIDLTIDVLRGSYKHEIKERGLDKIKTYGAGRDVPFVNWKSFITQMINQGIISIAYTDKSNLKWTPLSLAVIQGEQKVAMVEFVKKAPAKSKRLSDQPKILTIEEGLLAELKSWRSFKALDKKVPAYVVFGNAALEEMSSEMPTTLTQLSDVNGVGKVKLEEYGDELLALISEYKNNH